MKKTKEITAADIAKAERDEALSRIVAIESLYQAIVEENMELKTQVKYLIKQNKLANDTILDFAARLSSLEDENMATD